MKELKDFHDHNETRHREYMSHFINLGTGIACPQCGDELQDTNPSTVTCSIPPQKAVHCNTCKFQSFIVA